MKKAMILALFLLFSSNALALHEVTGETEDNYGSQLLEENESGAIPGGNLQKGTNDQYGSVIDNPPPNEDKSWWNEKRQSIYKWWDDE